MLNENNRHNSTKTTNIISNRTPLCSITNSTLTNINNNNINSNIFPVMNGTRKLNNNLIQEVCNELENDSFNSGNEIKIEIENCKNKQQHQQKQQHYESSASAVAAQLIIDTNNNSTNNILNSSSSSSSANVNSDISSSNSSSNGDNNVSSSSSYCLNLSNNSNNNVKNIHSNRTIENNPVNGVPATNVAFSTSSSSSLAINSKNPKLKKKVQFISDEDSVGLSSSKRPNSSTSSITRVPVDGINDAAQEVISTASTSTTATTISNSTINSSIKQTNNNSATKKRSSSRDDVLLSALPSSASSSTMPLNWNNYQSNGVRSDSYSRVNSFVPDKSSRTYSYTGGRFQPQQTNSFLYKRNRNSMQQPAHPVMSSSFTMPSLSTNMFMQAPKYRTHYSSFSISEKDNPFRPEGDLAKEANEFVKELKSKAEKEVNEIIQYANTHSLNTSTSLSVNELLNNSTNDQQNENDAKHQHKHQQQQQSQVQSNNQSSVTTPTKSTNGELIINTIHQNNVIKPAAPSSPVLNNTNLNNSTNESTKLLASNSPQPTPTKLPEQQKPAAAVAQPEQSNNSGKKSNKTKPKCGCVVS